MSAATDHLKACLEAVEQAQLNCPEADAEAAGIRFFLVLFNRPGDKALLVGCGSPMDAMKAANHLQRAIEQQRSPEYTLLAHQLQLTEIMANFQAAHPSTN